MFLGACARDERPHVLLISLDTLRADGVESMPFLSRLAREGVAFPRVYAASNWTLPSHASLLLSQPYSEHRVPPFGSTPPFEGAVFSSTATTLPEAFRDAGFRTFATTEGGYVSPGFGFERGFEEFRLNPALSHDAGADIDQHRRGLEEFLSRDGARPVFAFVHTYRIHDYFLNESRFQRFVEPGDRAWTERGSLLSALRDDDDSGPPADYLHRLYRGAAAESDSFLERLVGGALAAAPSRPWLIAVTSDHGEGFSDVSFLRGHGSALSEEQLRIPWIVWSSSPRLAPREPDPFASLIDIAPSLLRSVGIPVPGSFRGNSGRLAGAAPDSVAPVESAFFPGTNGLQLALVEPDRAFVWVSKQGADARADCYRRGPGEGAGWQWAPDDRTACAPLETISRRRVRSWLEPGETAAPGELPAGSSAELEAQLRSLGYL